MATLSPVARADVVRDLAAVVYSRGAASTAANDPVFRTVRSAGLTWSDLLARPDLDTQYVVMLVALGPPRPPTSPSRTSLPRC